MTIVVPESTNPPKVNSNVKFFDQMIANLPRSLQDPEIGCLKDQFIDTPAIICSNGPSMNRNLDELVNSKQISSRALIIANEASDYVLDRYGWTSHLVIACDPQDRVADWLRDTSGAVKIYDISMSPSVFGCPGPMIVSATSATSFTPVYDTTGRTSVVGWGSVASISLGIAILMGCRPIYFIGQDLSYRHNKYARGGPHQAMATPSEPGQIVEFESSGKQCYTTEKMRAYRNYMLHQAADYGQRVVNATGSGIFSGVEQLPAGTAREEIMELPEVDIQGRILSLLDSVAGWTPAQSDAMRNRLDALIEEMRPPAEHVVTVGIHFESWFNMVNRREQMLEDGYKYVVDKLQLLKTQI